MKSVGVFDAKQQLSALLAEVEAGGEVQITRHGKVIARLVPPASDDKVDVRPTPEQIQAEIEQMKAFQARIRPGPGWRELRDEGRKY